MAEKEPEKPAMDEAGGSSGGEKDKKEKLDEEEEQDQLDGKLTQMRNLLNENSIK